MAEQMTKDEEIFARRMLPHFMAGKSPEEAARAVLEDDARLLAALVEGYNPYFETGVVRQTTYGFRAQGLRDEITRRVHLGCKAA